MDFSQDLVRGSIIPIVLALLKERPNYGYEIVKLVNARSGGKLQWREGTLYPALHRLEADGLVKAYWQEAPPAAEPTPGSRMRKYYAITRRGSAELGRRVCEWRDFSTAVNAILRGA